MPRKPKPESGNVETNLPVSALMPREAEEEGDEVETPAPPSAPAAAFTPEQMAQLEAMLKGAFAAGAASVPTLPDDQVQAQRRRAAQMEAAKAEHPVEYGELRHGQHLRDKTVIQGRPYIDNGEEKFRGIQIEYVITPEGKRIVGGPFDGKFL